MFKVENFDRKKQRVSRTSFFALHENSRLVVKLDIFFDLIEKLDFKF